MIKRILGKNGSSLKRVEDLFAQDVEKVQVLNHFCAFLILPKAFSGSVKEETMNFNEIYTHSYDGRLGFNVI